MTEPSFSVEAIAFMKGFGLSPWACQTQGVITDLNFQQLQSISNGGGSFFMVAG